MNAPTAVPSAVLPDNLKESTPKPAAESNAPIAYGCSTTDGGEPNGGFVRRLFKAYKDEFFPKDEKKNGNGDEKKNDNGDEKKNDNGDEKKNDNGDEKKNDNGDEKKNGNGEEQPEAPRRALPAPFASPPFPSAEYQGYPLIGVPPDSSVYPLMKAIY